MKLPYGPFEDDHAKTHIEDDLRSHDRNRWKAMISDTYAEQTYRILNAIADEVGVTFSRRNADLRAIRADFVAGRVTDAQRAAAVQDYEYWKCAAVTFRSKVQERLAQLAHRVRQLRGEVGLRRAADALITLANAVAEHRATVEANYRPTEADRVLWARLNLLTYPQDILGDRVIPLTEAMAKYTGKIKRRQASQLTPPATPTPGTTSQPPPLS